MKRLKNFLLAMSESNDTYKEMYDGKLHIYPASTREKDYTISEPIYWNNEISYQIERTNRIELSKPTITIGIPIKKLKIAQGLVDGTVKLSHRGIPAADYCLRSFRPFVEEWNEENYNRKRTDIENGKFYVYTPNGKVLQRNCSYFRKESPKYYQNTGRDSARELPKDPEAQWYLKIKLMIQLPENKHKKTIQMLTKDLPDAIERYIQSFQLNELKKAITLYHRQEDIREWLRTSDYCAFIANGSVLPREKDTDLPMNKAHPFSGTNMEQIEVCGLRGVGIHRGVTVITGGGYSGKSTILDAISDGIYNHIGGDGREYVITDETAMKISAEDGRSVKNVNISPFIRWIPGGNPMNFSTDHASGSTSQAANIVEAVECGSKLLLIDEDKSATNFMIRDNFMQKLVRNEPIVPYTDRVQELALQKGVSTILVIGGSSEYLKVADEVIMMLGYQPYEVTEKAKDIIKVAPSIQYKENAEWDNQRKLVAKHFSSYPADSTTEKLKVSEKGFIEIGDECVDIRMIHNIVSLPQQTAIAFILRKIEIGRSEAVIDIEKTVHDLLTEIEQGEFDSIYSSFFVECPRWMELPRKSEVLAVINRMRQISFQLTNKFDFV